MKLILTAGHSNSDAGAIGNGYKESELNKELRGLIVAALDKIITANTRTDLCLLTDSDKLSYVDTITWINQISDNTDWLIDIHFNAGPENATGSEVFYSANVTDNVRIELCKELSSILSNTLVIANRGAKPDTQTQHGRIAILRDTKPKAMLIEVCFISNKHDMSQYQKHKYTLAEKIALFIVDRLI